MEQGNKSGARAYQTTHWTLIYLARDTSREAGQQALSKLLLRYMAPLEQHLQRSFAACEDQAKDWLHSFIERRILGKRLLDTADQSRGKFRTFLLNALDNFVLDEIRARDCPTRHPGAPLMALQHLADPVDPATERVKVDPFDRDWALAVLERAKEKTRVFYESKNRASTWAAFNEAILLPNYEQGHPRPTDAELAQRHGFASARQVSNAITTAKRTFGKQLRLVMAEYVETETQIDDEIQGLMRILATG